MKKILFAVVVAALFILPGAYGVELLTNGGFETGDLTGWTETQESSLFDPPDGWGSTWDGINTDEAKGGSYSYRCHSDATPPGIKTGHKNWITQYVEFGTGAIAMEMYAKGSGEGFLFIELAPVAPTGESAGSIAASPLDLEVTPAPTTWGGGPDSGYEGFGPYAFLWSCDTLGVWDRITLTMNADSQGYGLLVVGRLGGGEDYYVDNISLDGSEPVTGTPEPPVTGATPTPTPTPEPTGTPPATQNNRDGDCADNADDAFPVNPRGVSDINGDGMGDFWELDPESGCADEFEGITGYPLTLQGWCDALETHYWLCEEFALWGPCNVDGPDGDDDSDGFSNMDEWLAGTDPFDAEEGAGVPAVGTIGLLILLAAVLTLAIRRRTA